MILYILLGLIIYLKRGGQGTPVFQYALLAMGRGNGGTVTEESVAMTSVHRATPPFYIYYHLIVLKPSLQHLITLLFLNSEYSLFTVIMITKF